ncbi:hypothetical protein HYZ98_03115 [Candidatus Peregrinibacteria bacterium]|nr:hypothetical protein [Candidatus Peregrinibacteria bacterium]
MSQKYKFLLHCSTVTFISILFIETAHAANPFGDMLSGLGNDATSAMGFLIMMATTLSFVFFSLLTVFLDPTFIFDMARSGAGTSNLETSLNNIWQLSRDIMNVIFAFVLAGVAVYMVITAKKEFIKEYLGKFVLAVILVNFSWFFPRVILDVANVLTAAVYDIPAMLLGTNPQFCKSIGGVPTSIPYEGITNMDFFVKDCTSSTPPPDPCLSYPTATPLLPSVVGWECIGQNLICYKKGPINFSQTAGHASIINGLIINHAALQQMANVPITFPGPNQFADQLVLLIKMGLIVVIAFSLVFPLAAITMAMFVRIPVLWITIAFMPFAFLAFIGGDKVQKFIGGEGPKAIWDTFLKFAFLPALVAIPLAVGFILIQAGAQLQCAGGAQGTGADLLKNIKLGLPMVSNLYDLIWFLMAQLVLWIGVFSVLKGTPIVGGISGQIADAGKTVGRLAWKIPASSIPLIPGSKTSPSLLGAMKMASPKAWEGAIDNSRNLGEAIKGMGDRARGTPPEEKRVRESAAHLETDNSAVNNMGAAVKDLAAAVKDTGANRDNKIKEAIDRINIAGKTNVDKTNVANFLHGLSTTNALSQTKKDTIGLTDATIGQIADNINKPPPPPRPAGGAP